MNIAELKRLVSLGKVAQPTAKVILAAIDVVEATTAYCFAQNGSLGATVVAVQDFRAALAATPVK